MNGILVVFALAAFTGCSTVSSRPGTVQGQQQAHAQCSQECEGRQKLCQPTDNACQAELRSCIQQCERFSGMRSGDGQWGIDLPIPGNGKKSPSR